MIKDQDILDEKVASNMDKRSKVYDEMFRCVVVDRIYRVYQQKEVLYVGHFNRYSI